MSSYLGVPPQSGFITTAKQRVTSSTNNYVDLDHSISSLADVIVWVNFVKQDSTNLSLTTSTRITLGATLVASDVVEIAYLGKAVATQNPSTNSVTNDMLAGSIANSKLANSSITLNGSAVSLGGSATVGGNNTPSFSAKLSSDQSASSGAETVLAFATEQWDSDSKYNTSTYRFTPTVAGKYVINGMIMLNDITIQNKRLQLLIYKNGGFFADVETIASSETSTDPTLSINLVMEFNTTDYVELRFYHNVGSTVTVRSGYSFFQGYKLIGA